MFRVRILDQVALAALIGLSTYFLIGDIGVRMANTSTDDGLVAYAYLFKYPERFLRDQFIVNWGSVASASMLNWLPAVLFKYLDISPETCYELFVYLQNILLGLAVFRLTVTMTRSGESAWLAALFTLAYRPYWWNLGLFADLAWMPYGAWSALPFLVFAGSFALEGALAGTIAMLLIGGLIHPILGLFASATVGAYWLLLFLRERKVSRVPMPLISYVVLGVTVVVFLLPVLIAKVDIEQVPSSYILSMVLRNGHAIPWGNPACENCMPLILKGLIEVPVMMALALVSARHASVHPGLRPFLLASCAITSAACLLQVIAYFTQTAAILQVVLFRSTILLLIFAVPPVIALAWRQLRDSRPIVFFLACYVIVMPSPMALLAAALVFPWTGQPKRDSEGLLSWIIRGCHTVGVALFVLVLSRHFPVLGTLVDSFIIGQVMREAVIPYFFGFASTKFHLLLTAMVTYLCALTAWHWLSSRTRAAGSAPWGKPAHIALALAAPLIGYLLASSYKGGQIATSGEAREYYEVQAWARSSTAVDAGFIVAASSVYAGWRNFTHRPQITPGGGCLFYRCPKASLVEGEKVTAFFSKHGKANVTGLDANGLRDYVNIFGGEYAVWQKSWKPVNLPIAFENGRFIVYDLR